MSPPCTHRGTSPPFSHPKHPENPINRDFQPYYTPLKVARKGSVSYTLLRFLARCPPLTRYVWARVLSLQFFKIVHPLCPSTCPSTSHFSSILVPGSETRTFPDSPPSNAIRTPFKRGRNIKPTDALNAHKQKSHTRKRAALSA